MSDTPPGTLWGLGVGPGDPDLITLKALDILKRAPVIAYPAPQKGDGMARAIVAAHLPAGRVEIAIRAPMCPDPAPAMATYDRAAEELAAHLEEGRDVAVLCEGDPFLYGSFMYLFARLADRFPARVVPGVSSLSGAAAVLGTALAGRNDVLTVIPAPLPAAIIEARLEATDAAAIIKLGRHFAKVREILDRLGLSKNARYIERATMADQRTTPLAEVKADAVPYFSMILVHRRGEAWT